MADADHPTGTLERLDTGLLRGFVKETSADDTPTSSVCRQVSMKPSSAAEITKGNVVALKTHRKVRLEKSDTEFLPAALEIIETPASPVGRAIAGTIIAFAAIAVAWSCFGEVDIIATAQGRIIPTGKSTGLFSGEELRPVHP